jgi:predicted nucleic acid-binding protein
VQQHQVRGKSTHDANIVAVMLSHGVRRLVTFNSTDFERFDEIVLEKATVTDLGAE